MDDQQSQTICVMAPFTPQAGGYTYTKVCGRVIGYQVGHPDAFHSSKSIDKAYVEGVSITHGSPRSHISPYLDISSRPFRDWVLCMSL